MSLHESIKVDIARFIERMGDCDIITPDSIARACVEKYSDDARLEPHIAYASLEHFKQMARAELRGRFDDDGSENSAYQQGELFSGHLQERYPIPRKDGEAASYKRREALTADEVKWNVRSLRRAADARQMHARALEAWFESREAA